MTFLGYQQKIKISNNFRLQRVGFRANVGWMTAVWRERAIHRFRVAVTLKADVHQTTRKQNVEDSRVVGVYYLSHRSEIIDLSHCKSGSSRPKAHVQT